MEKGDGKEFSEKHLLESGRGVLHEADSSSCGFDEWLPRPILDLGLVKIEPAEYQPSLVLIKQPPSWTKRFSGSRVAPVGDEHWKSLQPTMKSRDDFIPLELSEEERKTAEVEHTVISMLAHFRDQVESKNDEDFQESESAVDSVNDADNEEVDTDSHYKEESIEEVIEEDIESNTNPIKRRRKSGGEKDLRVKLINKRSDKPSIEASESIASDDAASIVSDYQPQNATKCIKLFSDQMELAAVADDLKIFQEKGFETDCEVKVDGTVFKCHSIVLKRNENSFRELLQESSLKEVLHDNKGSIIIEIENMKSATFNIVLNYLYKAKVEIHSFEEAQEVLSAALMLKLNELVKICTRFCTLQMQDKKGFWTILDALLKDQAEPYQLTLYQIRSINVLLQDKDFLNISFNTLYFLVEQRYLTRCKETVLIEAVENWAKHHLKTYKLTIDFDNIRYILGPIMSKLRFLSLDQDDLVFLFKQTMLLCEKEKLELLERCVTNIGKPLMDHLSPEKYSRDISSSIKFFLPKARTSKTISVNSRVINCSFFFAPKKTILLLNFQYYSQECIPKSKEMYFERYTAQILRIEGNKIEVMREVCSREKVHYDSIIRVNLPVPVVLETNRQYCYAVKLTLHNPGLYRVKDNNYLKMQPFSRVYLEPLRSDFCWGNDGIFCSLNYKIL